MLSDSQVMLSFVCKGKALGLSHMKLAHLTAKIFRPKSVTLTTCEVSGQT